MDSREQELASLLGKKSTWLLQVYLPLGVCQADYLRCADQEIPGQLV